MKIKKIKKNEGKGAEKAEVKGDKEKDKKDICFFFF